MFTILASGNDFQNIGQISFASLC